MQPNHTLVAFYAYADDVKHLELDLERWENLMSRNVLCCLRDAVKTPAKAPWLPAELVRAVHEALAL